MDPAWFQVHTATPNLANAGDPTPGPRGLIGGGSPANVSIDMINISSVGSATEILVILLMETHIVVVYHRALVVFL